MCAVGADCIVRVQRRILKSKVLFWKSRSLVLNLGSRPSLLIDALVGVTNRL